jgi:hypothetical protein
MVEGLFEREEVLSMYLSGCKRIAVALVFGLLAVAPAPTRADFAVLDFSDVTPDAPGSTIYKGPYTSSTGYTVTASQGSGFSAGFNVYGPTAGPFIYATPVDPNHPNAQGLAPFLGNNVTLARNDNLTFSLDSIELARSTTTESGSLSVTFTGIKTDGTTVTQVFPPPSLNPVSLLQNRFQQFDFGSNFTNLKSVSWSQPSASNTDSLALQFTDVKLQTASAMPEPSGLVLAGLTVLGAAIPAWRLRGRQARLLLKS